MEKVNLTIREKQVIVNLAKAGVETSVIATAFGVPKQAVAAYKAWATMNSNGGVKKVAAAKKVAVKNRARTR